MHANARAFKLTCGICYYSKRAIKSKPSKKLKELGYAHIDYRICDWCDRANKGERRG